MHLLQCIADSGFYLIWNCNYVQNIILEQFSYHILIF